MSIAKHIKIYFAAGLLVFAAASAAAAQCRLHRALPVKETALDPQLIVRYEKERAKLEKDLALSREKGDTKSEALNLLGLGSNYYAVRKPSESFDYHNRALSLYRRLNDADGVRAALIGLAGASNGLKNYAEALKYLEELLPMVQKAGPKPLEGTVIDWVAWAYLDSGVDAKSFEYFEKRIAFERERKDFSGELRGLCSMGAAFEVRGNKTKAAETYQIALDKYLELEKRMRPGEVEADVKTLREALERVKK